MVQLEVTGGIPDDHRRRIEMPYSCRGPTVGRDATGVPYAEEGSNTAPFRSGVSPHLPSIESQNGYQNNDDGIGDRDVGATGPITRTSPMGEQGAVAAATSLLEQLARIQPDLRILSPGSRCVDRYRKSGKPKHRRRFWKNRLKLKNIRNKARRRKKLRKADVTMTLMRTRKSGDKVLKLTGQRSESRMSFTHRLKIDGVRGRVVTQMKIVYANVRTLRERRKRGMSGDMNNSSTKNNWRIPALVRMMQKHGIFLAVLSETRRATKEVDVGQGYVLLTSQNAKVPWMGGVGILLSPAAAEAWQAAGKKTWFPPSGSAASGRYLEVTLATAVKSEGTFTVASLYGPTMQCEMKHREEFIDTLRARVKQPRSFRRGMVKPHADGTSVSRRRKLPSRHFLLMAGDLNARVGKLTEADEGHESVLGKHNLPAINSNGSMLLDMVTDCRMCVANTFFDHSVAHTTTWMNAAHKIPRVIDHALIRQWSRRHVMDVRAAPELSGYLDSDHTPCVITLRGNPRTARAHARSGFWRVAGLRQKPGRLDMTPLTDLQFKGSDPGELPNVVDRIGEAMETKLDQVSNMEHFDSCLREISEVIFEPKPKNQTWTGEHRKAIDAAVDRRAMAEVQLHCRPGNEIVRKNWRQADQALRKLTRKCMADHVRRICQEAADMTDDGKKLPRDFFEHVGRVKRFIGCYQRPAKILFKDPRKKVDEGDNFFHKRFNQVCETIDEEEILSVPPLNIPDVESMFGTPDAEETYRAAMALRNGKSPDIKGVQAEMLKAVIQRRAVLLKVHEMILSIWEGREEFPKHWLESLGFTIWKRKHPRENLDHWRMVNVLVITSKIMSKMIHWRLQRLSAKAWSHTQYGFRKDSWTMDAVFIVKRLMEAFRTTRHVRRGTEFEEHQRTLYLMFEDFVKAFDSVPRELLWKELTQIFQVPEAFVELLKKFHVGFKTYTVFNGVFNKGFTTTSGVRQGCITGPDLWNFHFQVVIWAFARRVARKPNIRAGVGITYYCDGRFRTRAECKGMTSHKGHVSDVCFADDAAIIAVGRAATGIFEDFEGASSAAGLTMSLDNPQTGESGKTKLLRITGGDTEWEPRDDEDEQSISTRGIPLPFVREFLHLGSIHSTSRDLGVNSDINRRLKKGFSAQGALDGLWRDKHISRASKAQLTSSITLPTALYGSCNWALTRPNVRRLEHFWNRITRWTYGVHARIFQDVGKTHKELRRDMGLGEVMMFVHRRVLVQAGHLARKPIEDPAKQLLFGHVSDRVVVRRTRSGGRTGRQSQPPKTMTRYIRQTLNEQTYPGFDIRIWQLLAQDRVWWKAMAHATKSTTSFGGPNKKSLATRAEAVRKQRRKQNGMIKVKCNSEGDEEETEVCPLRCGYVGKHMAKHISAAHPLHPVAHYCSDCGFAHHTKGEVTRHVMLEHDMGEASVKARIMQGYVYKWDKKAGYLRTYPPGTLPNDRSAQPYREGWLGKSGEESEDDNTSTDNSDDDACSVQVSGITVDTDVAGVYQYTGDDAQEARARGQRRSDILQGRDTSELSESELRAWMRTMSYTRSDDKHMGWGPKGKLTRYKARNRRQRVGQRKGCTRECKWDDHKLYSARTCPLHPKYKGDKPRVEGDHPDAMAWKRQQQQLADDKQRREAQLHRQCTIPCGYGCGGMFRTKLHRKIHMQNCEFNGVRTRNACTVPGCKFKHANAPILKRHVKSCKKTYAYTSPLCPACGVYFLNRKTNPETGRVELDGYRASAHYSRHLKLYQQSRQVDCMSCGAPHLVPWCTESPREMGRHFRCSDNYFDLTMGSPRCREVRPGEIPAWKQWEQQQATMGENSNSEDVKSDSCNEPATVETTTSDENIIQSDSTTDEWDPMHVSSDEHVTDDAPTANIATTNGDNIRVISAWATRPADRGDSLPHHIRL